MATLRSLSLITTLFASAALSQTVLDSSALPACALQCPILNQANSACVPSGGAPVTNQATYQSCFCQSGYLTTLHTTAAGICDSVCGTDDATKIQQWYSNLCTSGQVVTPNTGATATAATTLSTSTKSGSTSTSTSTGSSSAAKSSNDGSWISNHWKWVLCLIVVFLAMILFGLLGCWLRRRHKRKVDRARASSVAATGTLPSAHSFSNPHLNPPTTHDGLPEMSSAARTRPSNLGTRAKSGSVTFKPENSAAAMTEEPRSKGRATETIAEATHPSKERKRKSRLRK